MPLTPRQTIIESLKYVTTGDMPPNTKGGAFIHDPGLANDSTVAGEVKLRFKNVNGARMIVNRRVQVTKKKGGTGGLTMKTLEGVLSYDGGDKKAVRRALQCRSG